ncbi:four helix bundle protein [Xanthomarina sp. F2636L]|uniref:four helix bundle protein n=1 Tax=Xanthomarina sp. F2636L TaxID=2996018 RepID=UPI003A4C6BCF
MFWLVGANYIEGNEKLEEKDLKFRLKISRKEAKESEYWLRLLKDLNEEKTEQILKLE